MTTGASWSPNFSATNSQEMEDAFETVEHPSLVWDPRSAITFTGAMDIDEAPSNKEQT